MEQIKTIAELINLEELSIDSTEIIELLDGEITNCINSGDFLGAGEWLASSFKYHTESNLDIPFAKLVALWASPVQLRVIPVNIEDLIQKANEFNPDELCNSLIAAYYRLKQSGKNISGSFVDLIYKLNKQIEVIYGISKKKPNEIGNIASAKYESLLVELYRATEIFVQTNLVAAKLASIELIKKSHLYRGVSLSAERPILSEIELLLGTAFRKFCESYENNDTEKLIKRAPEIKEHVKNVLNQNKSRRNSVLWNMVLLQIASQVNRLIDEATWKSEVSSIPTLELYGNKLKLDLSRINQEMLFSCRLANVGQGKAFSVSCELRDVRSDYDFKMATPSNTFDLVEQTDQIIKFSLTLKSRYTKLEIPIRWKYLNFTNANYSENALLIIEQQLIEPQWENVLQSPPYSINPVKVRENLFGRNEILDQLKFVAHAGTSAFLWGQKRVGKTSILQVLSDELEKTKIVKCIFLRMGELIALHEGQLAHRIACRLIDQIGDPKYSHPSEEEFGAGMSKLVPFAENFIRNYSQYRFIIIIDEFDDLDPAFYLGERGRLFVHAIRSLSEIGLTFFFVGSERMYSIYQKHSVVLNKWTNFHLDAIKSIEDCRALIAYPVRNVIEYDPSCIESIIEYCGGNPFYMHLLCSEIFNRCWHERRTFASSSDLEAAKESIIRTMGETNYAHLWSDNPVLEELEKEKQAAENCLVLTCISALGGSYETPDQIYDKQESLGLNNNEKPSLETINIILDRLRSRGIISQVADLRRYEIALKIFRDWLRCFAELRVLPEWKKYCRRVLEPTTLTQEGIKIKSEIVLPISEEDLLSVSQNLVYCGKQKDVSEIRIWLSQFDDDIRIEMAFQLLKRISDKGFITEGAKLQSLLRIEEMLKVKRQQIGNCAWNIVRGKLDNLCITFVDSELKSGATTARELSKRLRPGKYASPDSIGDWIKNHVEKDPILVMVDDFAGTGNTISKGLKKIFNQSSERKLLEKIMKEGRILCYLLYSFPEALSRLKEEYEKIEFIAVHVLDDDLRAFDENAKIFSDKNEINFVKEFLLPIGRELTSQNPLGYGDLSALIVFHNSVPNNTLPIFWSEGTVNGKPWRPLFPRA